MNADPEKTLTETEEKTGDKPKKEKKKKTVAQEIASWFLTLLGALVIALSVRQLLFEPIRVEGGSMMNTLRDGEIVLVTKPAYHRGDIHRGDVVICRYPNRNTQTTLSLGGSLETTFTHHTLFVKRLIALPGDILEMREGAVYVNGELVDESAIDMHSQSKTTFSPVLLGEDSYFVMGDNRGNSNDSRAVGPISRDMIVGHVTKVLWPLSKFLQNVQ